MNFGRLQPHIDAMAKAARFGYEHGLNNQGETKKAARHAGIALLTMLLVYFKASYLNDSEIGKIWAEAKRAVK